MTSPAQAAIAIDPRRPLPRRQRLKAIIGGSAGNLVEWYDWYAYAALALYFAPSFFPSDDRTVQLMEAAAIFAVGFVMRPLGAWIMGIYCDRHGRKAGLALAVVMMGGGSLAIAVAPTWEQAGFWAPLMLLLARLVQGLSVGGEYGASATYLSEMATRDRRGFYSSFQYVTLIAGQLLALGVLLLLQALLDEQQLESWGWRIGFVIGGVLAVAAYFLRREIEETPDYEQAQTVRNARRSSGLALFRHHPREVALVIGMTSGGTLAFYAYTTYMQKFLVNTTGFGRDTATAVMAGALFLFMLMQPLFGLLSDRIGRRPLLLGFAVAGGLLTVPLFTALERVESWPMAFALVLTALVIVSGYTSVNAVVKAELFPPNIRALGVALPYALANMAFGGTAEYVALSFKAGGAERGFYWYLTIMIAVMGLVVWRLLPETRGDQLAVSMR